MQTGSAALTLNVNNSMVYWTANLDSQKAPDTITEWTRFPVSINDRP